MRIAIVVIGNSRRSNYLNGFNLRYGNGGGSGTDTSTVLVAEHLAKQGHEVVYVAEKLEEQLEQNYKEKGLKYIPGQEFYGVKYTNLEFDGIDNREFDILISMLWFEAYDKLPITVTKGLIYWSHMQWIYGISNLVEYAKKHDLALGIVHISNWEEKMNGDSFPHIKSIHPNSKKTLIPNPIFDEIINEVKARNITKQPGKFIFHASWPRGGNIAAQAVRELDIVNKELHAFDYLMVIQSYSDTFFHNHSGVDKKTLFTHLAESEYFIYPLYTPYQDVHKDTFSCVVAEALALGVIVVTYPLGALPENFNDYCAWLDAPEGVDFAEMQTQQLSKDLDGKFMCTDNIVAKINHLEANPQLKEEYRTKAQNYILENFNINKVGKMWVDFIDELVGSQPDIKIIENTTLDTTTVVESKNVQDVFVVVAKFQEDVSWLKQVKYKTIVYDKSNNPIYNSIQRPNVGKEAETLLRYIITYYNELPDLTIFLQGDPRSNPISFTYEEVIEEINKHHENKLKAILAREYDIDLNTHWLKSCKILKDQLFNTDDKVRYSSGAQYVIPKENILCRPLDFYKSLHKEVLKFEDKHLDENKQDFSEGIDAWTLEILWSTIFDTNIKLKA